jgi:hypothetical protein
MFATALGTGTCFAVLKTVMTMKRIRNVRLWKWKAEWSYAKRGNHILTCDDDYSDRYVGDVSNNGCPNQKGIYVDWSNLIMEELCPKLRCISLRLHGAIFHKICMFTVNRPNDLTHKKKADLQVKVTANWFTPRMHSLPKQSSLK